MSNASKTALFRTTLTYNDNPSNYAFGTAAASLGTIDQPGIIRDDFDATIGARKFRFAKLDSTSANVISGDMVMWLLGSNSSVTTAQANAAGNSVVAGFAASNITVGNYGWFQIAGQHAGLNSNISSVTGDLILPSTTDKKMTSINAGNTVNRPVLGICTANTANSLTAAKLDIPE